jgi:hypothetical protein
MGSVDWFENVRRWIAICFGYLKAFFDSLGTDSSYQRISHLTVHSAAEYRSGEENGCELSISAKE